MVIDVILQTVDVVVAGEVGEHGLQSLPQVGFRGNLLDFLLNQILDLRQLVQDLADVPLDGRHGGHQDLELVLHQVPG